MSRLAAGRLLVLLGMAVGAAAFQPDEDDLDDAPSGPQLSPAERLATAEKVESEAMSRAQADFTTLKDLAARLSVQVSSNTTAFTEATLTILEQRADAEVEVHREAVTTGIKSEVHSLRTVVAALTGEIQVEQERAKSAQQRVFREWTANETVAAELLAQAEERSRDVSVRTEAEEQQAKDELEEARSRLSQDLQAQTDELQDVATARSRQVRAAFHEWCSGAKAEIGELLERAENAVSEATAAGWRAAQAGKALERPATELAGERAKLETWAQALRSKVQHLGMEALTSQAQACALLDRRSRTAARDTEAEDVALATQWGQASDALEKRARDLEREEKHAARSLQKWQGAEAKWVEERELYKGFLLTAAGVADSARTPLAAGLLLVALAALTLVVAATTDGGCRLRRLAGWDGRQVHAPPSLLG